MLTFLAGAELDPNVFRAKWKESTAVGLVGFTLARSGASPARLAGGVGDGFLGCGELVGRGFAGGGRDEPCAGVLSGAAISE